MGLMDGLSGLLGTKNTFKAKAPTNAFQAKEANLAQSEYGGTISDAQRAALAGPGQANQTAGAQSGLAQALMDQAAGRGPSLAQGQLRRATEANLAQGAGAIASQRGINPALAARLISQNQGAANQTAAGQSADLAAQEQVNARGLLAQALSAQRAQDIAQQGANTSLLSTAGGLQQGQNAVNLQNSLGVQGMNQNTAAQNASLALGAQQINAGVAAQNAQTNAGLAGGIMGGVGSALSAVATGGIGAASGGEVPTRSALEEALAWRRRGDPGPISMDEMPRSLPEIEREAAMWERRGAMKPRGIAKGPPEMMARGGRVPERKEEPRRLPPPPASDYGTKREADLPDLRLDTYQGENVRRAYGVPTLPAGRYATGGRVDPAIHDFRPGGRVPGRARFPGDTPANDTVPALLSPAEIVLPRSVTQHPKAEDRAADFVAAIKRQKQGAPGSYGELLSRVRRLETMADGGEVGEPEEPSLWSRVRRWAGADRGDESVEASRDVAEGMNAALPEAVSARGGIMERRRRLAQMDRDTQ